MSCANEVARVLREVQAGETVEITVRGDVVAELGPQGTDDLPDQVAISVVTLAELHAGVLLARTAETEPLAFGAWPTSSMESRSSMSAERWRPRSASYAPAAARGHSRSADRRHRARSRLLLVTRDERQADLLGDRAQLVTR
ncbi:MAG TPA: hypothetical protein VHJ37_03200 [Thermoleophilaceae bacterium]|nr:hypothetical protein [Thermoleophilaceae bacterium]